MHWSCSSGLGSVVVLAALLVQGCGCDAIACETSSAAITIWPKKFKRVLPRGTYTWSVTTNDGKVLEGQCEIDGPNTQCDGSDVGLLWRGSDVMVWTLFVGDDSTGDPRPESAEIDIRFEDEVLFDGTYTFEYESGEPASCESNCLDANLRIKV